AALSRLQGLLRRNACLQRRPASDRSGDRRRPYRPSARKPSDRDPRARGVAAAGLVPQLRSAKSSRSANHRLKCGLQLALDQRCPKGRAVANRMIIEVIRGVVMQGAIDGRTIPEPDVTSWRILAEEREIIACRRGRET